MIATPARMMWLFDKFKTIDIIVLGDVMLDEYIYGEATRISPEAPVPVVKESRRVRMLGGAGNIFENVRSLGGHARLITVVGDDLEGMNIWELVNSPDSEILTNHSWTTTIKTRVIAQHQHVCRIDYEDVQPLDSDYERLVLEAVTQTPTHGIIIGDYAKGIFAGNLGFKVFDEDVCPAPKFVDSKGSYWQRFANATLVTPNKQEAERMTGLSLHKDEDYEDAAQVIFNRYRPSWVLIKRGSEGISSFQELCRPVHIRAKARQVFDVSGAGDTVIAMATLAYLAGASAQEAAYMANLAGAVAVGKLGTTAVTPQEILDEQAREEVDEV